MSKKLLCDIEIHQKIILIVLIIIFFASNQILSD